MTRAVAAEGFYYAPDPSSQQVCTIGGNVAENSGCAHERGRLRTHLKDHGIATVVDVSELLADASSPAPRQPLPIRVAFQDSCHLKHAQRIEAEPRAALAAIPGPSVLEPAEQHLCCGSAGIYNLVPPQAAGELGDRKAERVLATEPKAYASGNPGCLVQVTAALRRASTPLPAFHPVELVDASIRGLAASDVLARGRR